MAGVPRQPLKPSYISSTDTTITVQLYPSPDTNGAPIQGYRLYRDIGGDDSDGVTTEEVSYDGISMTFTIQGLSSGVVYKIALLAVNSEGSS
jgi:hypothetical protein